MPTGIYRFLPNILEAFAVGFVFVGGLKVSPFLSGISIVILFLHFAWNFKASNAMPTLAYDAAERIYFLGYLCTITGFGVIGYKVGTHPEILKDPQAILLQAGITLSSTIVGLILMNALKTHGQTLEMQLHGERDPIERMLRFFSEFEKRLEQSEIARTENFIRIFEASNFTKSLETIGMDIKNSGKALQELRSFAADAKTVIGALADNCGLLNSAIEVVNSNFAKTTNLSKHLEQTAQSSHALKMTLTDIQVLVGKLNDNFAITVNTTNSLAHNLSKLEAVTVHSDDIASVGTALSKCTKILNSNADSLKILSTTIESLEEGATASEKLSTQITQLSNTLDSTNVKAINFSQSIEELSVALDGFIELTKKKIELQVNNAR